MWAAPSPRHGVAVANLCGIFWNYARATGRGRVFGSPVDVVLSPYNVLHPDVFFVTAERTSIIDERKIGGPPDIAVEILSDSTRHRDRVEKKDLYARFGVREYWIVDPVARRVEMFVLEGGELRERGRAGPGETFASAILPDLTISVDEIFA